LEPTHLRRQVDVPNRPGEPLHFAQNGREPAASSEGLCAPDFLSVGVLDVVSHFQFQRELFQGNVIH
jgi:hypothetical protein